jgi:hypothetical protein
VQSHRIYANLPVAKVKRGFRWTSERSTQPAGRMSGVVGEWQALAPVPDATAIAWGMIEVTRETLRAFHADPAVISILDAAIEQLEKGANPARAA